MQTNASGTPAPVGALANPIPMTSLGVTQTFTPEEIRDRLAALTQPFPPELIEWRVTNTTRDRRGSRGQVVAYADPRAYTGPSALARNCPGSLVNSYPLLLPKVGN